MATRGVTTVLIALPFLLALASSLHADGVTVAPPGDSTRRPHTSLGDRPPADFAPRADRNHEEGLLEGGNSTSTW